MTLAMHEQDGLLGATKDLRQNPVFNDQKLKLGVFSANWNLIGTPSRSPSSSPSSRTAAWAGRSSGSWTTPRSSRSSVRRSCRSCARRACGT